jgi:hypothetical protein
MIRLISQRVFHLFLILAIMIFLTGCRDHETGKHNASAEEITDESTEPLQAQVVVKDLITSSGQNGEPLAYIIITRGEFVNFKGNVTGGTPPYTYNWDFGNVRPDVQVKDPGNIEYINVTRSKAGIYYPVEFTVTDKHGNISVDSIVVLVYAD